MSDRDQELIGKPRGVYEAFNRGDFDTAVEIAHAEVEFIAPGGAMKGAAALRAWMEPDAMEDQRIQPLEYRANGNRVLVHQNTRARGASTGIELNVDNWAVWTFDDDGLAKRVEGFLVDQEDEALKAAGLSE